MKNSFIFLIGLLFLIACGSNHETKQQPLASKGILNAEKWDFEHSGNLKLNGEWEFYWKQLLSPEQIKQSKVGLDTQYFEIPNTWNNHPVNSEEKDGHGYASFRLIVKVDSNTELLALRSLEMATAYKLWANSKLVLSNGEVGTSYDTMTPRYLSKISVIKPNNGTIELVLQVSNFYYTRGGPWNAIELGTVEKINMEKEENLTIEFFLFGAIIIMGCYHLGLYLLRRNDRSPLYFGLICLLIALRTLLTGERVLHGLAPWISWEMLLRIEIAIFYFAVPLFLIFLGSLFEELSRLPVKIITTVCLGLAASVLLPDPIVLFSLLPFFYYLVFLLSPYIFFCLIQAVIHKKEGSVWVGLGAVILILTTIYDILEAQLFFSGITTTPIGLFLFIFIQSFMLSNRFSSAFAMVEELSTELEQKVEQRTLRLEKAKEDLEQSNQLLVDTQSQLVQSQKMEAMGTMAGGIAHEFNNILGSMLGFAEMLKWDLDPKNEKHRWAQEIVKSGERASNLVQQILTFSRTDRANLVPISIQSELKETKDLLNVSLSKLINLDIKIDMDCRPILANKTQISQILVNLCKNSEHAILPSEGTITIELKEKRIQKGFFAGSLETKGDFAQLSVSDTGTGISEEELTRIFDPFYTTKEVNEGTGLGLSIVHGIVKKHNGHIKVESEIGKGTKFLLYFPITQKEIIKPKAVNSKISQGAGHILLVEDDYQLASYYRLILKRIGYEVTTTDNGVSALETFKKNPNNFNLVFTDQSMPQMSGLDMSKEISKINPSIPIIMSTGNKYAISAAEASKQGIKAILMKPVRISNLTATISGLLEKGFE